MMTDVLLVDDDRDLSAAIAQSLEIAGLSVQRAGSANQARTLLDENFSGVVVSDVRMPGMDGLEFLDLLHAMDADLPVVLMTGHGDIPMAVRAMQTGAYDFITKPFATEQLVTSIRRALEKRRLVIENRDLRARSLQAGDSAPLIGQTPAIERLRQTLRHIADTDVDVLVAGETGSGKEVVATLLHQWSERRSKGNFVALNCGALPDTVLESELFGHEAGAFTGAQKRRVGRIEHASGGTLFLDEIESMPVETQVKLLRVIEAREIAPLGTNEIRPVDLRVVAAAKVDLSDPSTRGEFREDLYYRLNVVTICIPPLRERKADIPLLYTHFLQRACQRFKADMPETSRDIHDFLMSHDWPGNVRELSHFAERRALGLDLATSVGSSSDERPTPHGSLPEQVEAFEKQVIENVLRGTHGDVKETLAALGIPRKTFYDKLQRHGINRSDFAAT
ncbi:sigma-54-dependent transcriptional regulator [Limoniibacter endophyticus]|uniref:Fis family transcriptional regulator n=1 Tax=Limoniibacter endophyticus TaxID=1565040 RepID=A0A8J3DJZ7_9HYPH|nr:sigma-54 dependent transcriptional regulator [Limoniibacter endophyticus]GHC80225.1 Fis family transcriptional regulator [Limoniibacter endophyticus]